MISSNIVLTLGISLAIQAVFFVFAATLKTDKVTDLSYGLSFIILAIVLLIQNDPSQPAQLVLGLMIVAWGIRLAAYLLYRIVQIKRDPRFDGVRERFWKFLQFWFLQGIVVWAVMLPVILWFDSPTEWSPLMPIALVGWAAGLVIETVADWQKFKQKSNESALRRWIETGLWRYSRHPNYFGELLCWWSVLMFVAGGLEGWEWMGIVGPLVLTYLLLYVTGIPPLEKAAEEKWGNDRAYRHYRSRTPTLVPALRRRSKQTSFG